jgi:hypothetical protein
MPRLLAFGQNPDARNPNAPGVTPARPDIMAAEAQRKEAARDSLRQAVERRRDYLEERSSAPGSAATYEAKVPFQRSEVGRRKRYLVQNYKHDDWLGLTGWQPMEDQFEDADGGWIEDVGPDVWYDWDASLPRGGLMKMRRLDMRGDDPGRQEAWRIRPATADTPADFKDVYDRPQFVAGFKALAEDRRAAPSNEAFPINNEGMSQDPMERFYDNEGLYKRGAARGVAVPSKPMDIGEKLMGSTPGTVDLGIDMKGTAYYDPDLLPPGLERREASRHRYRNRQPDVVRTDRFGQRHVVRKANDRPRYKTENERAEAKAYRARRRKAVAAMQAAAPAPGRMDEPDAPMPDAPPDAFPGPASPPEYEAS